MKGELDDEARGVLARIAQIESEVARHEADLKAATADHWAELHRRNLYDALRRKDQLSAQLQLIAASGRRIKQ
jgi:hypothetical protein